MESASNELTTAICWGSMINGLSAAFAGGKYCARAVPMDIINTTGTRTLNHMELLAPLRLGYRILVYFRCSVTPPEFLQPCRRSPRQSFRYCAPPFLRHLVDHRSRPYWLIAILTLNATS